MDETAVTKRGRPRRHESNAERQRAYRQRSATAEAKRVKKITGLRAVFIDPNKVIDKMILEGNPYSDMKAWLRHRRYWRPDLDRARIPDWIASLKEIRRNLNRFIGLLKKL